MSADRKGHKGYNNGKIAELFASVRRLRPGVRVRPKPEKKGTDPMKSMTAIAVLSILMATQVQGQETPAVTVAVVRMDRAMNRGNFYEKVKLLFGSQTVVEAIRKTNADIKATYDEIVKTEDSKRLGELEQRLQFLKRKVQILRQGIAEDGRDRQVPFREFVAKTYGAKYPIIVQDPGCLDQALVKRVEVVDITDEAVEKFRAYVDRMIGDESPALDVTPAKVPTPALATPTPLSPLPAAVPASLPSGSR
jgi:hypothetical protein